MSEGFRLEHHLLNMQLQVDQNSLQIQVDIQHFFCWGEGGEVYLERKAEGFWCV